MHLSVIGLGVVGAVTCAAFAQLGHRILAVDRDRAKLAALAQGRAPVTEPGLEEIFGRHLADGALAATSDIDAAVAATDLTFVAVGTPGLADGSLDFGEIRRALAEVGAGIARKPGAHVVVLQSTVVPGFCEAVAIPDLERACGRRLGEGLEFHLHPEFLRAGSALADFLTPSQILIGERFGGGAARLRGLLDFAPAPTHIVSYRTAESAKLLANAFHALKVAFANEAGRILAALGADAREALDVFRADAALNLSPDYLRPGFAYGGSCLPKDVAALARAAAEHGVEAPLIAALPVSNGGARRDALALIAPQPGQRLALFGLAFKPGTDDLRASPWADLAFALLAAGCDLAIVDPPVRRAWAARREGPPAAYAGLALCLTDDAPAAIAAADAIVVGHLSPEHAEALRAGGIGKPVIDLGHEPRDWPAGFEVRTPYPRERHAHSPL